jgi:hypothetical protein
MHMDVIDKNWIAARLTGKRGEVADLARAMGVSLDKASKTIKGERKVQASEIPGLLSFFGVKAPADPSGDAVVAAVLALPDDLRAEALQYIEFLKGRR